MPTTPWPQRPRYYRRFLNALTSILNFWTTAGLADPFAAPRRCEGSAFGGRARDVPLYFNKIQSSYNRLVNLLVVHEAAVPRSASSAC